MEEHVVPLQDAGASAPAAPHIEAEPPTWQPRAMWVAARQLAGAASFFFLSFVFAYFYLRSLDVAKKWKIGSVHPSIGLGVAIVVVLILSAALFRFAAMRATPALGLMLLSLLLAVGAIVLQVVEWTTLGFGPASGGYASVFIGWTAFYAVWALACVYWMETQVATAWRRRREGAAWSAEELVGQGEEMVVASALEACSFFWAYYVGIGVVAFVILYVV
jgi:heme/copper-type cytochrome/quinol oxidase subunit 3